MVVAGAARRLRRLPLLPALVLVLALGPSAAAGAAVVGDDVHGYLMAFGYLPQSDLETGNLRTEEQLRSAIRTLQEFAHLPVTGEVDAATRRLLRRPRCGLPDGRGAAGGGGRGGRWRRYALHGRKWDYTNLTWSLQTRNPRNMDPRLVRQQLGRALDVWAQNSKLSFREISDKSADILVYFERGYHGDGYPFDGRGQILAHAFFPGDGRGGDAHFDEEENWLLHETSDESEGTSLFAVAAHEFGHSLGLSHSSVPGALMYPWYQGIKPNFQLPDDDRHGIQQLYGAKERLWGYKPHYIPSKDPHKERGHATPPPPRRPVPGPPGAAPDRPTPAPPPTPPRHTPRHHHHTPHRRPTEPPDTKPDTCDTSYDAISVIRGEVFIFKGKYFWRIGNSGLSPGYPAEILRLWHSLPRNLTHVDAVYERMDKKIVFFIGKHYYVFNANYLERGYPKPLTHLGLPASLEKVDGAMVWGHNKKTYFYSGTMYWRFDDEVGRVELDYPRDMSMWKGVGYNIDAVFQWKDGKTYFFKGKSYWKLNDMNMKVENEKPMLSAPMWMGCPRGLEDAEEMTTTTPFDKSGLRDGGDWTSAGGKITWSQSSVISMLFLVQFVYCLRI